MNKNRNSAKNSDKKLATDARYCSQIFTNIYMTYTLLANVQSQDCEAKSKLYYQQGRNYAFQYKDSHYPHENKLEFGIHDSRFVSVNHYL